MKASPTKALARLLLAALIICAAAGTLYGLARIAKRHGPKLVEFITARMPQLEWPGLTLGWMGSVLVETFALAAIAIFWAFLLSPLFFWIGRRDKPGSGK
jgi:hypothetical protein